ncbi:substrate-binding domain-containing protein [Frankia sp. Cpl3]|nr:substrate-binding domain-containing protein [Frankia sp. Cpl3]
MPSLLPILTRQRNRLLVAVAGGSLVLSAAACSTGDSGGNNAEGGDLSAPQQECVDNATAYLDERGLLPETLPEGLTPLSKAPTEGLTITRLAPAQVPTALLLSEELVKIAPEIGWTAKAVSFDGSVEDLNRKAMDAVASSDIVQVDGIDTAALKAPIEAAKERGVLFEIASTAQEPESVPGFGATPYGGDTFAQVGELGAYNVMQAIGCKGKVAVFSLPTPALRASADSLEAVLKDQCKECDYSYTEIPFADIGSPAATNTVVSALQADPSIEFAYFTLGDLAVGIGPALTQAAVDVQVGGAIPNTQNLETLKQDENAFWLGFPQETSAWTILDTAARALDAGEPTVGNRYPVPVYTPDNIETTDEIPAYPTDIGEQFKELWQVN